MSEHIGPSLWHGREINSCVSCKYLRCRLTKSGRHPDYDYFCMHPVILSGILHDPETSTFLAKVKERFPDKVEYFTNTINERRKDVALYGEFISNDETTPETPHWCPVIKPPSTPSDKV